MKNERKPRAKYSNRYEALRITDTEEKTIAPMMNPQHQSTHWIILNLEKREREMAKN